MRMINLSLSLNLRAVSTQAKTDWVSLKITEASMFFMSLASKKDLIWLSLIILTIVYKTLQKSIKNCAKYIWRSVDFTISTVKLSLITRIIKCKRTQFTKKMKTLTNGATMTRTITTGMTTSKTTSWDMARMTCSKEMIQTTLLTPILATNISQAPEMNQDRGIKLWEERS